MAAKAELKARISLDHSAFTRGLASAQAGVGRLSAGLLSITRAGVAGFTIAGAALVGLGTALAIGTKKAFDLGGRMVDIKNLTGRSAKEILIMRRALEDAGVSMEKIDQYMLTGRDRGNVIARTLANLKKEDWASAAASVGKQAEILDRSAEKFDHISDILGHAGQKIQGFFVGVADSVADTLLPIVDKLDKVDLAGIGQKFGQGLVMGAKVLMGFFQNPSLLFDVAINYFRAGILGLGNVFIAVFKSSIEFFKNGMLQVFSGIGSAIVATLVEAFQDAIAFLQAGIEHAMDFNSEGRNAQRHIDHTETLIQQQEEIAKEAKPGSGAKSWIGTSLEDAEAYKQAMKEIVRLNAQLAEQKEVLRKADKSGLESVQSRAQQLKQNGVRFGITDSNGEMGGGMTAGEWLAKARADANAGIARAGAVARNFSIPDVMGAGAAFGQGNAGVAAAAQQGAGLMPGAKTLNPGGHAWRFTGFHGLGGVGGLTSRGLGVGAGAAYNQSGNIWGPKKAADEKSKAPINKSEMLEVMRQFWGE